VEGARPRGRPKRTWRNVVQKDCQAHKFNREDTMDPSTLRKLIKDRCKWVNVSSGTSSPGLSGYPRQMVIKWLLLCCCICIAQCLKKQEKHTITYITPHL